MTPTAAAKDDAKTRRNYVLRLLLAGVAMSMLSRYSGKVMQHYELSLVWRVLLALTPLLPLIVLCQLPRTLMKTDELDLRIHQESVVLAFYGLFAVLIGADLLGKGGMLTGFVWKTEWILGAMVILLGLGYGWTVRRYR